MCMMGGGPKPTAAPLIAAPGSDAVRRRSDMEMRMRRARSGAAADILTGPLGAAPAAMAAGAAPAATLGGI
jgi:hypothetical protein